MQSSEPTYGTTRREDANVIVERRPIRRSQIDSVSYPATATGPTPMAQPFPSVDWRSVAAGAFVACSSLLFLGLLGLALGLTTFNAATAAAQNTLPAGVGRTFGMWTALSCLLAFLAGGYVAARMSGRQTSGVAWTAALVFLAVSPLLVWLLLGGLTGAAAGLAGAIAGLQADPTSPVRANPTAVGDAAGQIRDATWGALAGSVLGLIGSVMGAQLAGAGLARPKRSSVNRSARRDAWDSSRDWDAYDESDLSSPTHRVRP